MLRAVDRISQFIGLSVAHFYLIAAIITTYEVVMRYVFHAPTQWAFEVVMTLCAIAWLFSCGYITMRKQHIGITVLYLMAPPKIKWWLDLFIMVVSLLAVGTLAYAGWEPMMSAMKVIERSGSAFNPPAPVILKTALVIGAALYALQALVNLIRHLGDYRRVFARPE